MYNMYKDFKWIYTEDMDMMETIYSFYYENCPCVIDMTRWANISRSRKDIWNNYKKNKLKEGSEL